MQPRKTLAAAKFKIMKMIKNKSYAQDEKRISVINRILKLRKGIMVVCNFWVE